MKKKMVIMALAALALMVTPNFSVYAEELEDLSVTESTMESAEDAESVEAVENIDTDANDVVDAVDAADTEDATEVLLAEDSLLTASAPLNGWQEVDGKKYWYENGVKQGTEGRGKEIYDPASDAWYWLDAVQDGAMAVSKDVYQESRAGEYGDTVGADGERYGKWVRYDENGHMVKGWQTTDAGTYYFDLTTGAMAKGITTIDGVPRTFNTRNGKLIENGWWSVDGSSYWSENGVRQGTEGRGKEIYDPARNGWFWLDAVQNGAKAVSKDVYQESYAGQFADREDGTGKWVRYDETGRMVKGWDYSQRFDGKVYYFDLTTGAMAKGTAVIDGVTYEFDRQTGVLLDAEDIINEVDEEGYYNYLYDAKYGAYCGTDWNFSGACGLSTLYQDNEVNHLYDGHSLLAPNWDGSAGYTVVQYHENGNYYSFETPAGTVRLKYDAEATRYAFEDVAEREETPQSVKDAIAAIDFSTEDEPKAFMFSKEGYKMYETHYVVNVVYTEIE